MTKKFVYSAQNPNQFDSPPTVTTSLAFGPLSRGSDLAIARLCAGCDRVDLEGRLSCGLSVKQGVLIASNRASGTGSTGRKIWMHTYKHEHANTHARACVRAHTHTPTRARTQAHTHMHTHTHPHTHTHAHTHTHTHTLTAAETGYWY